MDVAIIIRACRFALHNVRTGAFSLTVKQLLIATGNNGKLRELRELLSDLPLELLSLNDFPNIRTVPETGLTFIENATLKATGYARQTGVLTLADDSGLVIDALNGAPGVWSARYLSEAANYDARNAALLTALKETRSRSARFVCAVAVADEHGELLNVFEAVCEGQISKSVRGSEGFGYDPIFIPAGYDRTFGELTSDVKNVISHRARAIAAAREYLVSLTGAQTGR
jgi:XTP/dITP diphosphohydrolase